MNRPFWANSVGVGIRFSRWDKVLDGVWAKNRSMAPSEGDEQVRWLG